MTAIKKVAFFVEGYTEQEFLKCLLTEIFGTKKIAIEIKAIRGGTSVPITSTFIQTPAIHNETEYYVLIYNCGGDSAIKSYILDRRSNLIQAGYEKIIGLLDVYPNFKREEIHDLEYGLMFKVPQKEISIKFILSIMEIEGWFLAEENHYEKIDPSINADIISKTLVFDPSVYNTELIDEPAKTLKSIYQIAGKTYKKDQSCIDRTIKALDYGNIYLYVPNRIKSLKNLIDEIELIFED